MLSKYKHKQIMHYSVTDIYIYIYNVQWTKNLEYEDDIYIYLHIFMTYKNACFGTTLE